MSHVENDFMPDASSERHELAGAGTADQPLGALIPIDYEITNFRPGPGGDVLDLQAWLAAGNLSGYVPGTDPFATGLLRLRRPLLASTGKGG